MCHLSVVIPSYKCASFIGNLCTQLNTTLSSLTSDYEIILVNDCSPDNDWQEICKEAAKDQRVKGINLSRNFGQHYAISAGLSHTRGEWIVVMDGDLQDKPDEIASLYLKCIEGYDIVLARRKNRKDSYFKRLTSQIFYRLLAYLTETEQNAEIANFGIYNRKVIDAVLSMHDQIKYFPAMIRWVGFNKTEITIEHAKRTDGRTGYNVKRLIDLAINVILSFSDKPLKLTVYLGLILSTFSFIYALYITYQSVTGAITVLGYSSLIVSIWFLSGVIITILGILGLYVGHIFERVKNRPLYIIDQLLNIE